MLSIQAKLRTWITHPLFPIVLICILAFSLRLYRLQTPTGFYFDEVYHGYTAVEYAAGNRDTYNPWAHQNTPGLAYEWVHPPLAKLIMAGSVWVFGPVSWAWRLPSALFGTAVIGLSGILAWVWWRKASIAIFTSAILAIDGLVLVMSRLAMNDVFFLSFLLLSLILYSLSWEKRSWKRWLFAAGISLGAALASKWTTVYIFPLIAIDTFARLAQEKKWSWERLSWVIGVFLVTLPAMYLLSHAQYFWWGYSWDDFVILQQQIYGYHTNLVATHPYQSIPLQWILDLRPVWFHSSSSLNIMSNIYALANPIFLWSGLGATLLLFANILQNPSWKSWANIRVLLAYCSLWMPWIFSPRIMFFYHYLPALPFLAMILAGTFSNWIEQGKVNSLPTKNTRKMIWVSWYALAALWLIFFFPHLTALPVSAEWAKSLYYLLPGWQ